MAANSAIEWTQSTWNPVTGCTKISPGCANCYAERMALRLKAMGQRNYRNGFQPTVHPDVIRLPLKWKKPQLIFVNSMSDLFHKEVSDEFIRDVFSVMERAHWHIFQVLTKRSERLAKLADSLPWSENIWMGVSVENDDHIFRIEHLRRTPAAIKFISFEPLLGPIEKAELDGIDWVIAGGESGPKARAMKEEWVLQIRDCCTDEGIEFFFKQWGGVNKKATGRLLKGRTYDNMPHTCQMINREQAIT